MKKNLGPAGIALLAAVLMFILAACTPKKVQLQIDEQGLQLERSASRIAELEKNNAELSGQVKGIQASRDEAVTEKNNAARQASALSGEVSSLKTKVEELEKSLATAREAEAQSAKRIRGLTGQVGVLRGDLAERDEMIAAKNVEVGGLQKAESEAKAAVAEMEQRISSLSAEKTAFAGEMEKKLSGKNTLVLILAVLLGLALIGSAAALLKRKKSIE